MIKSLLKNRVASNASWIIAVKIVQALLGLVITMICARYLGPANYGIINYAASVVAFVLPVATLGFTNTIVQEIINQPEKEGSIFGTVMVLSCISSIACGIAVFIFVSVANAGEQVTVIVCMLYSILLLAQVFEMIQYWFQAKLLAKYSSVISLIAYTVVSAYKIYLLVTGKSVYWFAVSQSFDYALIAILGYIVYRKKGGHSYHFDWELGKRMFAKSRPYILSSLMVTIFAQTDRIMINQMMTDADVGFYTAAATCAGVTSFVFCAVIDSFRPAIFEKYKENNLLGYERNLKQLYCIIIYASLAQSVVMCVFAKWVILILYGSQYVNSIDVLRLIVWYTTFSYLGAVRDIWILSMGKQKYLWRINACGAGANILLNALMIPVWGIMGAAFTSLVTQFFTNVVVGWIMKPIRENNRLMVQALNPKYIIDILKN